ncbi:hypothetical protein ACA910_017327 [Epithemia clementina (nom. ined.)]
MSGSSWNIRREHRPKVLQCLLSLLLVALGALVWTDQMRYPNSSNTTTIVAGIVIDNLSSSSSPITTQRRRLEDDEPIAAITNKAANGMASRNDEDASQQKTSNGIMPSNDDGTGPVFASDKQANEIDYRVDPTPLPWDKQANGMNMMTRNDDSEPVAAFKSANDMATRNDDEPLPVAAVKSANDMATRSDDEPILITKVDPTFVLVKSDMRPRIPSPNPKPIPGKMSDSMDFSVESGGYRSNRGAPTYPWSQSTPQDPKVQWELAQLQDYMAIADVTHDQMPLGIENGAPDFTAFLAANGNVGFGTSYPEANLHVVGATPSIRLEEDASSTREVPPSFWDIVATGRGFEVLQEADNQRVAPFAIATGAPSMSLVVSPKGNVGIGTDSPSAKLHVMGGAQIEGSLQVGQCQLDPYSCQWKRSGRRRLGQGVAEEDGKVMDFVDLESQVELLQQETAEARATIQDLESRVATLEAAAAETESIWMQRMKALEAKLEALVLVDE